MATIQITLSDEEKRLADELFKNIGMTTSGAIKVFLNQAVQEQGLPFTPRVHQRRTLNPHAINATLDENGTIVLPDDAPDDVKDWLRNG